MKKWGQTTLIDTAPEKVGGGSVAPDIVLLQSMPGVTLRTAKYAIPRSRLRTDKKKNLVTSRDTDTYGTGKTINIVKIAL